MGLVLLRAIQYVCNFQNKLKTKEHFLNFDKLCFDVYQTQSVGGEGGGDGEGDSGYREINKAKQRRFSFRVSPELAFLLAIVYF